ncbi:MAG: hypothetical protein WCF68_01255 [Terriglobales bacterium]
MDNSLRFQSLAAFTLCVMLVSAVSAQNAPQKKTLIVNGRAAEGAVVQIDGHSYLDLDTFARTMNAAVSFEPGRVIMTIPAVEAGAKPERATPGLSKDFARAGISQLAEMWEWKGAIASAIRSGVAAGSFLGPALQEHRVKAEESLSKSSLAAKTESDQKALQLLKNQIASLREWDSNTQAAIQSLHGEQAVDPTAAQNDPLLTKITECGRFLNAMLVDGQFADSSSCH